MIRADLHEQPPDNGTPLGENATAASPIAPDGTPELGRRYAVPAREGRAVRISKGQGISVINTHGTQACDFWAFNSCRDGLPHGVRVRTQDQHIEIIEECVSKFTGS
jgi:uncharacterized protein YcgI (DUF1989 family)